MERSVFEGIAREIVARLSKKDILQDDITSDMSFSKDLGIDSLQFIYLILEVELKIGTQVFSVESIAKLKTFNDLIEVVSAQLVAAK